MTKVKISILYIIVTFSISSFLKTFPLCGLLDSMIIIYQCVPRKRRRSDKIIYSFIVMVTITFIRRRATVTSI